MKHTVHRYVNRTLTIILTLAILGNIGIAVWQTHLHVVVSFGKDMQEVQTVPLESLEMPVFPVPQHKPKVK